MDHINIEGTGEKLETTSKLVSRECIVPLGGLVKPVPGAVDYERTPGRNRPKGPKFLVRVRAQRVHHGREP